jgi:drug/metabolite transporter (DMT)-like permease
MKAPILDWSLAAALATMLVWGVNFAFTKHVLEHLGVGAFVFIRFSALPLLAAVLLVAIFRSKVGATWPRREDLPRFVLCGLVGHALHISVVMNGMNLSTPFSSSLVLTSGPLFTLGILAALGAERLRARQVAGTLIACAGIVIFLGDKFARGLAGAGTGDMLLLVAAFMFALYTVLVQPIVKRYGPLIVMSYTLFFSAPFIVVFTFHSFVSAPMGALPASVWIGLVWGVIGANFFGWLMWTWVNSVRGIARSAPFNYLTPPIAGLVAWLTLGEIFTWLKILGAVVTMAGVAWAQFGGGKPPSKEAGQPDAA